MLSEYGGGSGLRKTSCWTSDAISQLSSGCCWALGGTRIIRDKNTRYSMCSYNRWRQRAREGSRNHGWRGIVVEGRKEAVRQLNPFWVNLMGLHNFRLKSFRIFIPFREHRKYKTYWWASCRKKKAANFFVLLHKATNREVWWRLNAAIQNELRPNQSSSAADGKSQILSTMLRKPPIPFSLGITFSTSVLY